MTLKDRYWYYPHFRDLETARVLSDLFGQSHTAHRVPGWDSNLSSRIQTPSSLCKGSRKSVYRSFPTVSTTSYATLPTSRYLPRENRFTIRNKNSLSVCLLRECRYDFSQSQQGLVNTHTFLYTRGKKI